MTFSQLETQQNSAALSLINNLLTELKRLDDKMVLTEVHLLKSRIYCGIGNLCKAKVGLIFRRISSCSPAPQAALTSSRTAANAIYCPPSLQASVDLQSGILLAEDKDYKTAYSYFFEAFENLSAQGDENALGALKYMLLCHKVMLMW
jgi:26S proteasome regulatory subunit N6